MSHRHISLIIMLLCLLHFDAVGIERHYIRFQEKAIPGFTTGPTEQMPSKTERTSSSKGCIVMTFDESVPDSIRVALTAAKEAWEAKLPAAQEIYIQATMDYIEGNVTMITDVYCSQDGCPQSLLSQKKGYPIGDTAYPDGHISFNSNISWNCSFSNQLTHGYSMYTIGLRAIALVLGFGSSIYADESDPNIFWFACDFPTYFDQRIHRGTIYLHSLEPASQAMADFVTSNILYVKGRKFDYRLYAPTTFKPWTSLIYLDKNSSLMHYAIGEGDKMFTIDTATLDVLNGIGWDFATQQEGANIKCNDIASDGIGSSYSSHTFSLDNIQTANGHLWKFSLKNKEGIYEEVSNGANATFTIAPVQSTDKYYINTNGDLEGKIECQYTIDSQAYTAKTFYVSLELKPLIISIGNMTRIPSGDFSFYLTFTVNYTGADKLIIAAEEEYSTIKTIQDVYEPFLAHIKTCNLSTLRYSWITIYVQNKYGTTEKMIEIAPEIPTELKDIAASPVDEITYILNMKGICVSHVLDSDISKELLPKGMYIRRTIDKNGRIRTQKFIVR